MAKSAVWVIDFMRYFINRRCGLAWLAWLWLAVPLRAQPVVPGTTAPLHAATNLLDYNVVIPGGLDWEAQNRAFGYARMIAGVSTNTINIITQNSFGRITAALSLFYNKLGSTSLWDCAFYGTGYNATGQVAYPTVYGRYATVNTPSNRPSGLHFNGSNTTLNVVGLPSSQTHTIAARWAGTTNAVANSVNWIYLYGHTNGANTNIYSALLNGVAVNTSTAGSSSPGFGVTGISVPGRSSYNGSLYHGYSEGLNPAQRQFRNIIATISTNLVTGRTNMTVWVDGLLGTDDSNFVCNAQFPATRLTFGAKDSGGAAGYAYNGFAGGTLQQWWALSRSLSSNEAIWLDRCMRIADGGVDVVVYGDDATMLNNATAAAVINNREWPQQLWRNLDAWTNAVTIHNHAYPGRTASTLLTDITLSLPARAPYLSGHKIPSHMFVLAGSTDIAVNGVNWSNTWGYVSNICSVGRSNGYIVHACTLLPLSTTYSGYTAAKASNIMQFNNQLRALTNASPRVYDYLWDLNSVVTITNANTQLFDGLNPTNATHAAMGAMIGTNYANWLWRFPNP
jgi:hypothetical protein